MATTFRRTVAALRAARHSGLMCDLHPAQARLTGVPYSGVISLGATVTLQAHAAGGGMEEKVAEVPPFQIGSFPIMAGSSRCHTRGLTRAALKATVPAEVAHPVRTPCAIHECE